jgi:hypothetical protein
MVVRAGQRSSLRFQVLRDTPAERPRPDARRAPRAHQVEASVQKERGQQAKRHSCVDPARRHTRPNVEAEVLASIVGTRHRYFQATATCRKGVRPLGHPREKFEPPTCGQPQPNRAPTSVCLIADFLPPPNQGRPGQVETTEVGSGQVSFADQSRPGYRNPREGARCASLGDLRPVGQPGGRVNGNRDAT